MIRRLPVVLALLAFSSLASATERDCLRRVEQASRLPRAAEEDAGQRPALHLLTAMFEQTEISDPATGEITKIEGMEVLVVRLGADGKPVLACVDSKEAARRFLEKPVEDVGSRKAQEQ